MTPAQIAALVGAAGFDLFGIVPLGPSHTAPALQQWLDVGNQSTMEWMERPAAVAKRTDPRLILPGAKSVVMLAWKYTAPVIPEALLNDPSRGIIARYALYSDYHTVLKKRLVQLAKALQHSYLDMNWKAYVDTGPFLEREWAARAGLGFVGRNAMLINFFAGSYLFLAEILVDVLLPEYTVPAKGSCASCRNCLGACPTGAIIADGVVDARKCISFLTIENRGAIPQALRPLMKNRIYGCDICQEVCPYNAGKTSREDPAFMVRDDLVAPPLETLLFFTDDDFNQRFAGSPIRRAKREGFMRNVAVALGNWGSPDAQLLLQDIIKKDPSALVREHAVWGLRACHVTRE